MEDAIKKEFEIRCDTIEAELVNQLMDTSVFLIRSKMSPENKNTPEPRRVIYNIINTRDVKDSTSFSVASFSQQITAKDTAFKRIIARQYAHMLRTEDLENHVVYYRTQNLGKFLTDRLLQFGFDTSRLRPLLTHYLLNRHISSPFYFQVTAKDSLLNHISSSNSPVKPGYILSKSFPTYKWWTHDEQFVRVVFTNPIGFVLHELKWVLVGSLLLVILVALCISMLTSALLREKKLSVIKDDFINNITHELKTPAAIVTAALEVLQEPGLSQEKSSRYLQHAQNSMKKFTELIDRVMDNTLYEKQLKTIEPHRLESVNFMAILNETLGQLQGIADKPVLFHLSNNTGINEIKADPLLFQQVCSNVFDNSVKYSLQKVFINISCSLENNYLVIHISDDGIGITKEALPHVFEKFYRAPQRGHAIKGYGLGLNYVQNIMQAHNGKVVISNGKETGITVSLYWPV
jgi:signal transduction histidine kinase